MHIQFERAAMLAALADLSRLVDSRNTIPILSCVLVTAGDGGIMLQSTDLDLHHTATVAGDVLAPGVYAIPCKELLDRVKAADAGAMVSLMIESDPVMTDKAPKGRAIVSHGRMTASLAVYPAADWPLFRGDLDHDGRALDVPAFIAALDKCSVAVSTEEARYYLNGVYWHAAPGGQRGSRMVATDGHRLVAVALPDVAPPPTGIIIPRLTVAHLVRVMAPPKRKQPDGRTMSVIFSKTDPDAAPKMRFIGCNAAGAPFTLDSKPIYGNFPDYSRVIPSAPLSAFTVDAPAFLDAVASLMKGRRRSQCGAGICVSIGNDSLRMSANHDGMNASADVPAATYGRPPNFQMPFVGINGHYLLDVVPIVASSGNVTFHMEDSAAPMIIQGDDPSVMLVLMPLRAERGPDAPGDPSADSPSRLPRPWPIADVYMGAPDALGEGEAPANDPGDDPALEAPESDEMAPDVVDPDPECVADPDEIDAEAGNLPVSDDSGDGVPDDTGEAPDCAPVADEAAPAADDPATDDDGVSLADYAAMLRHAADKLESVAALAADAGEQRQLMALQVHEAQAMMNAQQDEMNRLALVTAKARHKRRTALLLLRSQRAETAGLEAERRRIAGIAMEARAEAREAMERAERLEAECADLRALLDSATAPPEKPEAPAATPKPAASVSAAGAPVATASDGKPAILASSERKRDPKAAAHAILRKMGVPVGYAIASANPATGVTVE